MRALTTASRPSLTVAAGIARQIRIGTQIPRRARAPLRQTRHLLKLQYRSPDRSHIELAAVCATNRGRARPNSSGVRNVRRNPSLRSQFGARRVIPLIHRRFRVSNSIQIQNSRRAQSNHMSGAFPPTPLAPDLFAYKRSQP